MKRMLPLSAPARLLLLALLAPIYLLFATASQAQGDNPVAIENQRNGTLDWQLTNEANDVEMQIKGFASATSVNVGESIDFYISVTPAQAYDIEFFRMGWYGGKGGRLARTAGPFAGVTQPAPTVDASLRS